VLTGIGYAGWTGAIWLFDGIPADGTPDDAAAWVEGTKNNGYFGWATEAVGDQDGDGSNELLVAELFGGSSDEGTLWLLGGAQALASGGDVNAAAILAWSGEESQAYLGSSLASGDADGDGRADFGVGAYVYPDPTYGYTAGKAYLLMAD
jgi:hypothetical protein